MRFRWRCTQRCDGAGDAGRDDYAKAREDHSDDGGFEPWCLDPGSWFK